MKKAPLTPTLMISLMLLSACQTQRLVSNALSDNPANRGTALLKLVRLSGKQLDKTLPALIAALSDPDPNRVNRAVDALSIAGRPAVPKLLQAMKQPDPYLRVGCLQTLGIIGDPINEIVPELIKSLSDGHPLVRHEAATALGRLGVGAVSALPALKEALQSDPDEGVRKSAARALESIGTPEAKKALSASKIRE